MTELEAVPILGIFPDREKPLEVKIEIFEGPLELLLHMIRKKKVSIDEVRLADLTAAYLDYIRALQSVDLDVAGEFLEIAATLILIKSRTLISKPTVEESDEEEDPEERLRQEDAKENLHHCGVAGGKQFLQLYGGLGDLPWH